MREDYWQVEAPIPFIVNGWMNPWLSKQACGSSVRRKSQLAEAPRIGIGKCILSTGGDITNHHWSSGVALVEHRSNIWGVPLRDRQRTGMNQWNMGEASVKHRRSTGKTSANHCRSTSLIVAEKWLELRVRLAKSHRVKTLLQSPVSSTCFPEYLWVIWAILSSSDKEGRTNEKAMHRAKSLAWHKDMHLLQTDENSKSERSKINMVKYKDGGLAVGMRHFVNNFVILLLHIIQTPVLM